MSQRPKSITLDLAPVAAETTNRQLPRTISVSNGICSVESEEIAVIYSNFLNFFFIYSDWNVNTMPYYCAHDYKIIWLIGDRKKAILLSFVTGV